jgi:hypothetical protein
MMRFQQDCGVGQRSGRHTDTAREPFSTVAAAAKMRLRRHDGGDAEVVVRQDRVRLNQVPKAAVANCPPCG